MFFATMLMLLALPGISLARVDISVTLPPLVLPAPPSVVVIPDTYVYFVPDVQEDIFFYGGYWFRPYGRRWYRATSYNGPWVFISPRRVPYTVLHVPPNFRAYQYRRIPYGDLHRNWRTWEREKYWERHGWGRPDFERERHRGIAPSYRERERHDFDRGREGERRDFDRGREKERHDFDKGRERER
jgi:hypothetical protein